MNKKKIIALSLLTMLAGTAVFPQIQVQASEPVKFVQQQETIEYKNKYADLITNTIGGDLKIKNTSDKDLDLTTVKFDYYFSAESSNGQDFICDYAGISKGNFREITETVCGEITETGLTQENKKNLLKVTFKEGSIKPGEEITLRFRVINKDWTSFNQENDYSFHENENDKVSYGDDILGMSRQEKDNKNQYGGEAAEIKGELWRPHIVNGYNYNFIDKNAIDALSDYGFYIQDSEKNLSESFESINKQTVNHKIIREGIKDNYKNNNGLKFTETYAMDYWTETLESINLKYENESQSPENKKLLEEEKEKLINLYTEAYGNTYKETDSVYIIWNNTEDMKEVYIHNLDENGSFEVKLTEKGSHDPAVYEK